MPFNLAKKTLLKTIKLNGEVMEAKSIRITLNL